MPASCSSLGRLRIVPSLRFYNDATVPQVRARLLGANLGTDDRRLGKLLLENLTPKT
jgi:hypothetical protein